MSIAHSSLLGGSIYEEQMRIEQSAIDEGVARYNRLATQAITRGDGASLKPAERLLLYWFQPILDGVRADQKSVQKGTPEVGIGKWGPVIEQVDAEKLAVIALHETLSHCMQSGDVSAVELANHIGRAVFAEINVGLMRTQDKSTRKRRRERLDAGEDKKTVYEQERELMDDLDRRFRSVTPGRVNWWAKKSLSDAKWSKEITTHVGARLLWHVTEAVHLVPDAKSTVSLAQKVRKHDKGKHKYYIRLEPWVIDTIEKGHEARQFLRPRFLPMIVPPYAWSREAQGGYIKTRTPFVSKPTREQKEALDKADLTRVYEALTAVSSVAWRINRRVLNVMKEFEKSGGGSLGVPHHQNLPDEPKPKGWATDDELWRHWETKYPGMARPVFKNKTRMPKELIRLRWANVDPNVKKAYKRASASVIKENIRRVAMRKEFFSKIGIADRFSDREAIYSPHQFDHRGRLYAIPVHLNHQGDDVCRGLLEYSEGKKPDERGIFHLKVQAANCYGKDGVSFDERVKWVDDHMKEIKACADDPHLTSFWHHADESKPGACDGKPWQFLAACIALCDPSGAGAHLPVQRDGTCNGLQHYTAIGRDEKAAKAVNMLPGDKPESVYVDVAAAVDPIVRREARAIPAAASIIDRVGLVSKPLVKHPVMTTTYGVTAIGAREQVSGALSKFGFEGDDLYNASRYLSGVVLKGIGTVCESAVKIMHWLQECAKLIVEKDRLVTWTSPIGFPVVLPYRSTISFRVITVIGEIDVVCDGDKTPVDKQRHISAIAPGFVHCIDATHLMLTATACHLNDVTMSAVHDCYWSHAQTMDFVDAAVREWFVELHKLDLLGNLVEEWRILYPDISFPDPPPRGTYDIEQAIASPYMFH